VAVKLIDLQLIYGVAGAREKFEDLASQLVKSEQPSADKVRIVQGDGGIDVYVGELTDPQGIHVYQCKFFPLGLEDSQKGQIRKSFQACRDGDKFRLRKWTLCLPIDLSVDEKRWFEEWRSKQADSGVEIDDPWGALKLEGLLYRETNRELREAFFKEEHLTQIRELHAMLNRLLPDIAERLRQDAAERDAARQSGALANQQDELTRFVHAARESYQNQVGHAASASGYPSKRPSNWEVVIRPSWIPAHNRINTLKECWSVVEACRVRSNGWEYPVVTRGNRESGQDWVGATRTHQLDVESWRLSQKGLFVHLFPIWDDVENLEQPKSWPWDLPKGFVPQHFLSIDVAMRAITHIFQFGMNLAETAFDPGDGTVEISVRLTGTRDRVLVTWDDIRRLRECYHATEPMLEHTWRCSREELRRAPDDIARDAASWFFERFGWHEVSGEVLLRIQSKLFADHYTTVKNLLDPRHQ
jgi:hypothetical protein